MGAWGAGSFDNDAALDFVAGIETLEDIERAFVAANDQGHALIIDEIDADISCQIIVAAECICAMRGHRSKDMPQGLAEKVHTFGKPSNEIYAMARNNVSAVMSRSELCELWAESEARSEWNIAMTELVARLNLPQKAARKPKKSKKPFFNNSPCSFCGEPMGEGAFTQFDITLEEDEISSMRMGGWAHLKCLNAALHPRHMIQHWKFDQEDIEIAVEKLLGRDGD